MFISRLVVRTCKTGQFAVLFLPKYFFLSFFQGSFYIPDTYSPVQVWQILSLSFILVTDNLLF